MTDPDAIQRLKSARGHLDAVMRMLDDDRYCIDVLQQVGAVQAALERARRSILEHHLRTCVVEGYAEGRIEEMADELLGAFFGGRGHSPGTARCGHTRHEEASS
jgi:CsoR family transcriptional regulator, copper-sensing transcriptional repressor